MPDQESLTAESPQVRVRVPGPSGPPEVAATWPPAAPAAAWAVLGAVGLGLGLIALQAFRALTGQSFVFVTEGRVNGYNRVAVFVQFTVTDRQMVLSLVGLLAVTWLARGLRGTPHLAPVLRATTALVAVLAAQALGLLLAVAYLAGGSAPAGRATYLNGPKIEALAGPFSSAALVLCLSVILGRFLRDAGPSGPWSPPTPSAEGDQEGAEHENGPEPDDVVDHRPDGPLAAPGRAEEPDDSYAAFRPPRSE